MLKKDFLFTSESVSEGHPDKICDQISDAILDAYLEKDPKSRVAIECMVTTNLLVISGEVKSNASVDTEYIARQKIKEIGYDDPALGFDYKNCQVFLAFHEQSVDISDGIEEGPNKELGAGDQGIMFGYAINENGVYMPTPIHLAHELVKKLADLRKTKTLDFLRPDAKSQVTLQYENLKPVRADSIVISTQHNEEVSNATLKEAVIEEVIKKVIPENLIDKDTKYHINPSSRFIIGGPHGDCGVTGRKIIVDTYGGWARHGGGAFSGKDCSKVDRSACYAARYIAKNIVAAGLAEMCEIQLAYAIGMAEPLSIYINTYGTGKIEEKVLIERIRRHYPIKPADIIGNLKLDSPRFAKSASYGHFGRIDEEFTWENIDKTEQLKS